MADKALLLGINGYKSVSGLRGCENDVLNMRSLLTDVFRFDPLNVKNLLHTDVTKTRIRPLLKWLYQDTKEGDRLVLHFSGHGSYRDDVNGDEKDKRDELICLYDMDFDNKDTYFIDDELRDWTQKLPKGRQLLVVLDNCHSGTGTRKIIQSESPKTRAEHPAIIAGATDQRRAERGLTRGVEVDDPHDPTTVIARFVEPPIDVLRKVEGSRPRSMFRREVSSSMNHVLLAACRDNQTAADAYIDGRFHGAFTFHLCRILGALGGVSLSRKDLIEKLSKSLSAAHFDQVPQFDGPSDQGPLFAPRGRDGDDVGSAVSDDFGAPSAPPDPAEGGDSGTHPGGGGASEGSPPPAGPPSGSASDLPRRMEEFLAAYNRVLSAGGAISARPVGHPTGAGARGTGSATGRKVVVYVHGICEHSEGFSNDWWAALSPFAPDLQPGNLGDPGTTTGRRYEVIWSDLVRGGARDLAASTARAVQHEETRQRIVEILEDRSHQQAAALAAAGPRAAGSERALEVIGTERALFGIPGLDCINDFVQYLDEPTIREQVIGRFIRVVSPLLRAGLQVEVISHSWGTVVAYESLCQLESVTPQPPGVVADLFTVGSALSIGYVKSRLVSAARDGHRPRMVANWVNLDARGDIVGGPLRGLPFAVDHEFLNLEPIGCNSHFPSPACAHSSYFDRQNLATNSDIFGRFIAS